MELTPPTVGEVTATTAIATAVPKDCNFSNIIYWLDDSIASDHRQRLDILLRDRGARPVELLDTKIDVPADVQKPDQERVDQQDTEASSIKPRFDVDSCTHIITNSWNTPEVRLVLGTVRLKKQLGDGFWIVKPEWVTRSILVGLQLPQHYSPDPKLIFSGIIINCAEGFPPGDIEAIYGAVTTFGGQHRRYATKEITHMICVQPTAQQFKAITETGLGIKIVLPEWIQECIKLRRLVPSEAFEFTSATTSPPIRAAIANQTSSKQIKRAYIDQDDNQRAILWTSKTGFDQIFKEEQDREAVQKTEVFGGKNVLLGNELAIDPRTKEALDQWIVMAGGSPIAREEDLADCDIYITKWRDGPGYSTAIKLGKTVGTLMWFYHVLRVGRLTSPMDELLHYPVPRNGIPEFSRLRIAVTNYTGESREYLKKLITAMGGTWTNDMARAQNTHLIAANSHSEKVQRAQHWGINTVNHFWLEDCFVRWAHIGEGHHRYTDFPPGVNYMSLIGQAHLSDESLSTWTNKALTWGEEEEMGAVEQDMQLGDPTQPTPHATIRDRTPPADTVDDQPAGFDAMAMDIDTPKAGPSKLAERGPSRSTSPIPSTKRNRKQTRDSPMPVVEQDQPALPTKKRRRIETPAVAEPVEAPAGRSRRQAATRAEDAVHAMAEDMNLYTKEKKRKDVIPPSERKAARVIEDGDTSDTTTRRGRRRTSRLDTETEAEMEEEEQVDAAKTAGPSRTKAVRNRKTQREATASELEGDDDVKPIVNGSEIFLATTGITMTPKQVKFFRKHGVVITDDAKMVTHLVTDTMMRTPKFLLAMNQAPVVVTSSWVEACVKADALVDEADHRLQDDENEKKHGFKLAEALERARRAKQRGGLMIGHRLILSPGLKESHKLLKEIVTTAGGTLESHTPKKLKVEPGAKTYLISCEGDRSLWEAYQDKDVPIVEKEYILQGVWSMQLEPDKHTCV